jgi:hypothetical protein
VQLLKPFISHQSLFKSWSAHDPIVLHDEHMHTFHGRWPNAIQTLLNIRDILSSFLASNPMLTSRRINNYSCKSRFAEFFLFFSSLNGPMQVSNNDSDGYEWAQKQMVLLRESFQAIRDRSVIWLFDRKWSEELELW